MEALGAGLQCEQRDKVKDVHLGLGGFGRRSWDLQAVPSESPPVVLRSARACCSSQFL